MSQTGCGSRTHWSLTGHSPDTRRSTSDRQSEVLRRVSGASPVRLWSWNEGAAGVSTRGCGKQGHSTENTKEPDSEPQVFQPQELKQTTWGTRRGATGKTPSARAEARRGRGGWRWPKSSNCNKLRDQPNVVFQCRNHTELPSPPGIHAEVNPPCPSVERETPLGSG
jgi:hypothetical protein